MGHTVIPAPGRQRQGDFDPEAGLASTVITDRTRWSAGGESGQCSAVEGFPFIMET